MTEEIIAGRNAVFEALTSKRPINKIFIKAGLQGGSLGKIVAAAQESCDSGRICASRKDRQAGAGHAASGNCGAGLSDCVQYSGGCLTTGCVTKRNTVLAFIGRTAGPAECGSADTQRGCCGGAWRFIAQAAKLAFYCPGGEAVP